MGEVARSLPRINTSLDDHEVKYQPTMMEFKGNIYSETMSILIYLGDILSYISPKVVKKFQLQITKLEGCWRKVITSL